MLAKVAGPVHAVDEKNVRPAVVVVVDEGHAGAHGFREIFCAEGAVVVEEMDSGLWRDVAELNSGGFGRSANTGFHNQGKSNRKCGERTFHHAPVSVAADAEGVGDAIDVVEPGRNQGNLQDATVVKACRAQPRVIFQTAFLWRPWSVSRRNRASCGPAR